MARLPVPGSDTNTWGTVLNDFLGVEHNADGTLKKAGDITAAQTTANNAQTSANAKIDKSVATTKGDMLAASAASTVTRLGVGSNGQVLTADATQTTGLAWKTKSDAYVYATDFGVTFNGNTDDAANLQAAINAAVSANKPLFLAPGTAVVGTPLAISAPLTILGSGRDKTILYAKNGLNDYVLTFSGGTAGTGIVAAHFADFAIDGNSANQTAGGAILANGAVQCSFERLHCYSVYNWGLVLGPITGGAFGHHNRVLSCLFDNSGSSAGFGGGVWITSSDENWFVATDFEFLGGATAPTGSNPVMLWDQAGLQTIMGCCFVSGSNNCIAVRVQDVERTKIVNSTFDGIGGDSIFMVANRCIIANNLFTGIGDSGTTPASGVHLEFNTHYNVVSGNSLEVSTIAGKTRSLIREEGTGGSGDNIIEGNTLSPNAGVTVANLESGGTNTILRNNIGFKTENIGTATVANGTTTVAVTHGLATTPTLSNISVTPTNNLGTATKFWISGVGGTQFTINVDANPGATTATFSWNVRL
jgi:hypothetical protein